MPANGRQLGRRPGRLFLFFRPGVDARPVPTWCTNPRSPLFFRSLCTKSPGLFSARPARAWCTNPRKTLFFRPLCTKSPGFFSARPAPTWCTNPRKPCSFVPFAPSLRTFSALGRRGLGAQTPARPCSFVPFAPSLRTFSALGGKFPAGALKEEKENGRGHSPFPLSLNRKLPAERRKLTNCYSYAVYRASRYLYRSSASFMYCDAPENIFDKLNR